MLLIASAAIVLGLGTGVAAAAEVHFDPDGPAAKEYALPLDQAREEGARAGESDGPAGEKAPLFGAGVGGAAGGSGSGGGGSPGSGDGGGTATAGAGGAGSQQSGSSSQGEQKAEAVANAAIAEAAGYPLSSAILWVAAILALGVILAVVLRIARRPRPA